MRLVVPLGLAAALLFSAGSARGTADLRGARTAGGVTIYPDDRRTTLFYYGPGELALASDAEGRPELHLLQTRYTGTAAAGDQGSHGFRSLLSVRVRQLGVAPAELEAARRELELPAGSEIRPLPIQRLEAALVYSSPSSASPAGDSPPAEETVLPAGHFEGTEAAAGPVWSERTYVLALDPASSQLFWEALEGGRVVLSLGYAFFALGSTTVADRLEGVGAGKLEEALRGHLNLRNGKSGGGGAGAPAPEVALVRSGATSLGVDAQRWPTLLRRVDINQSLPPAYAALDVYCYDFNNALRTDLYEKQVEVEAVAVGGGAVSRLATFTATQPDLYVRGLRFPMAVRLDRPYRYRVTEVGLDGSTRTSEWTPGAEWGRVLDVTSPPAAGAAAGPPAEEKT